MLNNINLEFITEFFSHFVQPNPKTAALVVLNLILIESLLSVDNAAVLATMVMDLPADQRKRALRIGLIFAYIFRGTALIFASILIKIKWLKLLGGGYLVYLSVHHFYKMFVHSRNKKNSDDDELPDAVKHPRKLPGLSIFWSTVVMVELMDLTFSIDNVFAAVAFTDNVYLICTGVFIGIITMRIVAGYFVKLMEKFPFLDTIAFLVIGILGIRLCMDFVCAFVPDNVFCQILEKENADFFFSIFTVAIFFLPILSSVFFNFPKRKKQ